MKKIIIVAVVLALMAAGFMFYRLGKEQNYLRPCGGGVKLGNKNFLTILMLYVLYCYQVKMCWLIPKPIFIQALRASSPQGMVLFCIAERRG